MKILQMRRLNKFIGIPYSFGGEDKSGADCYGLIKIFYNEFFNIDLNLRRSEKLPIEENLSLIHDLFYEVKNRDFMFGDILTFLTPLEVKGCFHAGVAVNEKYILHSDVRTGSSLQPIRRYLFSSTLKYVFRLKRHRIEKNG